MQNPVLREGICPAPSFPYFVIGEVSGTLDVVYGYWTAEMRPPSRWWENVVKEACLQGLVEPSLPHSPGLLTSRLHLCESNKLLSYLGHCFVLVLKGVGSGHRFPHLQLNLTKADAVTERKA